MTAQSHLLADIGDALEWARPWLTTTAITASAVFLGLLLKHHLGLKRIAVEAAKVDNADEVNIRDHYAGEVRQLRERMDGQSVRHATVVQGIEKRLDDCHKERDDLRDDSRTLKDIVAGLIRIITQASASKAILLDSGASEYVRQAALRIETLFAPVPLTGPEEEEI